MNKNSLLTTFSILIGIVIVGYFLWPKTHEYTTPVVVTTASSSPVAFINGKTISLLVSDTEELREQGLSGKDGLSGDQAMIFVFDKPDRYEFWMKDMKFPIDIVWLDSSRKIVFIESDVSPETYPNTTFKPNSDSLYAFEFSAGFVSQNNLKIGDTVNFNLNK